MKDQIYVSDETIPYRLLVKTMNKDLKTSNIHIRNELTYDGIRFVLYKGDYIMNINSEPKSGFVHITFKNKGKEIEVSKLYKDNSDECSNFLKYTEDFLNSIEKDLDDILKELEQKVNNKKVNKPNKIKEIWQELKSYTNLKK